MFRRLPLWFVALLIPLDFGAAIAAGFTAWLFRFHPFIQTLKPVVFKLSFGQYIPLVVAAAFLNTCAIAAMGLYKTRQEIALWGSIVRLCVASAVTFSLITAAMFLKQETFESRFLVIAGWLFAIIFLIAERIGVKLFVVSYASRLGFPALKVLLIGQDEMSERIAKRLSEDIASGMRVIKNLSAPDIAEISALIEVPGIEEILLVDPNYPREKIIELIEFANERHIRFSFVPNLFQTLTVNSITAVIDDVPIVELRRTPLEGWGGILKKILDAALSLAAIIIFIPLMACIALAIMIDSPGPVIYRSRRVGPKGEFMMNKFRTMKIEYCTGEEYPNASEAERLEQELIAKHNIRQGPVPKVLHDPRRTKVGRFLEATSLDELPQFFNALKGDMSLVGPRPHLPKEVAQYQKYHRGVFALKPGITGIAQISGRSDLDFDDEVRLDVHYIENWSLWTDLLIIFKTPFAILFRKHKS